MPDESGFIIRPANIEEILDLRWVILRPGLPRELAGFEGDDEPTTHHFGAFRNGQLVACATFMQRDFNCARAWQLRGMSVHGEAQRSGVGRQLLAFSEDFVLKLPHSSLFWCNARVPAVLFYERQGWRIVSEVFDIPTAGPHVKMTKETRHDGK